MLSFWVSFVTASESFVPRDELEALDPWWIALEKVCASATSLARPAVNVVLVSRLVLDNNAS